MINFEKKKKKKSLEDMAYCVLTYKSIQISHQLETILALEFVFVRVLGFLGGERGFWVLFLVLFFLSIAGGIQI